MDERPLLQRLSRAVVACVVLALSFVVILVIAQVVTDALSG